MKVQAATRRISQRRGLETASQIVRTAERLWGERGIEGASLREICAEAGCSNKAAIGYYFGDKAALIDAIFQARFPSLELARKPLLDRLEATGTQYRIEDLLDVLFRPLLTVTDAEGINPYARFLRVLGYSPSAAIPSTRSMSPSAFRTLELIRDRVVQLPDEIFNARWTIAQDMCLFSIVLRGASNWSDQTAERVFSETLHGAASYLSMS